MENKVKVWIARDKKGYAFVHFGKPFKKEYGEWVSCAPNAYDEEFPSVKWEDDEPTEAYITLAEPQEQPKPKKEIDWEQRRYEIAKEMMTEIYRQKAVIKTHGQSINLKDIVNIAVAFADMLIKKLKEKSE